MWNRDLSAGSIGFAAATTLFAMIRYLSAPQLVIAVFLVVSASAFLVAVIAYATSVARSSAAPKTAAHRGQAAAATSPAV